MGVGLQLVLFLIIGAIFSPLFFALGIADNPYLKLFFILIASIITQRLVVRFYKYKMYKK